MWKLFETKLVCLTDLVAYIANTFLPSLRCSLLKFQSSKSFETIFAGLYCRESSLQKLVCVSTPWYCDFSCVILCVFLSTNNDSFD